MKKPRDYDLLLQYTLNGFGKRLPSQFKFFYIDSEGDLISISNNDDLVEAYEEING